MESFFTDVGVWLEGIGGWAYVAAPAIMAVVAVFPIPAEAPAMLNGAMFGPVVGTALTWIGAVTGAQVSFELSRLLGRPAAERLLGSPALSKADEVVQKAGWGGLLLARFIPIIAFTALNWGAGLTAISRWRFFWTTAVGIVPGAIVFTATGTGALVVLKRSPALAGWLAVALLAVLLVWAIHSTRRRPA